MRVEKLFGSTLMLLSLLIPVSCGRSNEQEETSQTDSLYEAVCKLTRSYTDSIRMCEGDTAQVEELMGRYQTRMHTVNMHFPASAERGLTEPMNDTIYMLTGRLAEARKYALNPRDTTGCDTIPSDTIKVRPPMKLQ